MVRKYNKYRVEGDVAILFLTQGKETVIDLEDLDRVRSKCSWSARLDKNSKYYVVGNYKDTSGEFKTLLLHRFILNVHDSKVYVDHKDNDGLNNQKTNIRVVSNKQNMENRKPNKNSFTGIKGVIPRSLHKGKVLRWEGKVFHNGISYTKRFPKTEEGLKLAEQWVISKRAELFTHSDGR